jgi:hypothetical protein
VQASQDIRDALATLIPQINLQLRKLNLPSRLFQRKHANIFGSPLFRVDIITKTNAGKLKKHLIHKE